MKLVFFLVAAVVAQVNGDCGLGWAAHGGNCFKTFHEKDDRTDFFSALGACADYGATLSTVADSATNMFVKNSLPEPIGEVPRLAAWIGGIMLDTTADTISWTEFDAPGGAVAVSAPWRNWFRSESDIFPKSLPDTCVTVMNDAKASWRNPPCLEKRAYVCQRSLTCNVANCVGCVADDYCAKCEPGYYDVHNNGKCEPLNAACDSGWALLSIASENCFTVMRDCGENFATIESADESNFVTATFLRPIKQNAWVNRDARTSFEAWIHWYLRFNRASVTEENKCVMINKKGIWHNKPCRRSFPQVCRKHWNY